MLSSKWCPFSLSLIMYIEAGAKLPPFRTQYFQMHLSENLWISLEISLKSVSKFRINNNPALVQIMAWCLSGNKPLSELMMA